ncbi:YtpR family tRNA-binding protein [Malacoplasma muris]|uniref:YtpR family tRNA-binding protein n=1 Tax=Malacoplasma muris TaxID=2119 RepID=UPI00398E89E7
MINIFYNKKGLNDILTVKVNSSTNISRSIKNNSFLINFDNDKVHSIAIKNVSNFIDINEGYLNYDNQIKNFILKVTNINLDEYDNKKFIIGEIVEVKDIPNTHLHVCKVNIGNQTLQIVCGAKNVKNNMKVVVAQIGTIMPNGMVINKGKLQGFDSFGMLCSEKELFNKDIVSTGILEITEKYSIGDEFVEHYNNN